MIHVRSLISTFARYHFEYHISSHNVIDHKTFDAKCIHHLDYIFAMQLPRKNQFSLITCSIHFMLRIKVTFIYANGISMALIKICENCNFWTMKAHIRCTAHNFLFGELVIMDNAHPQGAISIDVCNFDCDCFHFIRSFP